MISEKTINYLLVILAIILLLIVIFRFISKDNKASFSINVNKIKISSLDGNQIKLIDILRNKKDTYILLFKLNDCYTCIAKGIADIQNLSKSGSDYICIVIHDSLNDIKNFAETFPEINFHQITTKEQYENIHSLYFPVIANFKNKRLINYRFITP
jgi:hypothetical protein